MNKYIIFLLSTFYFLLPTPVRADWFLDRSGTLVQIDGAILGDDDTVDSTENEDEVESEDKSTEDRVDTSPNPSTQRQFESQREAAKQHQEKSRELLKQQTEARLKSQETNGRKSEVEIKTEAGKFKLKQEIKDARGKLIKKQEIDIKDGESLHVEEENGKTVRIDSLKDGRLEMVKDRLKTKSDLNLKVGEKNEISVTLPNGKTKEVSLPDKALERLVANGVISQNAEEENNYTLIAGQNGDPVYQVEGVVEKKLLGLFKLKFAQKMEVAATQSDDGTVAAGDVVNSESRETGWRRLLYRLSSN